jgi:hypothetical protein
VAKQKASKAATPRRDALKFNQLEFSRKSTRSSETLAGSLSGNSPAFKICRIWVKARHPRHCLPCFLDERSARLASPNLLNKTTKQQRFHLQAPANEESNAIQFAPDLTDIP